MKNSNESFANDIIDIDEIQNWQECLFFTTGKIVDAQTFEPYTFTTIEVQLAFEYWREVFRSERVAMNGSNEAQDRSNKHFNSQAGMVLAYLNRSGQGKYQLDIE